MITPTLGMSCYFHERFLDILLSVLSRLLNRRLLRRPLLHDSKDTYACTTGTEEDVRECKTLQDTFGSLSRTGDLIFTCISSWSDHWMYFVWEVTNLFHKIWLTMFRIFHLISNFNTPKINCACFLHGSQDEDRTFGLL